MRSITANFVGILQTLTPGLRARHDKPYLVWITKAESVPLLNCNPDVDDVWTYDLSALARLQVERWDAIYNFSNDATSAALASMAQLNDGQQASRVGFVLSAGGTLEATNEAAGEWLEMAAFDRLKKNNTASYQEIMFRIAGLEGAIPPPRLSLPDDVRTRARKKLPAGSDGRLGNRIIGINTGAGSRWPRKMLAREDIVSLLKGLRAKFPDDDLLLLGGINEQAKNRAVMNELEAVPRVYCLDGDQSLLEFAAIVESCSLLICGDTLSLHLATALNTPCVALFGPTSEAEIYSYGGLVAKISSSEMDCLCCYSDCDKRRDCMNSIAHNEIIESAALQLDRVNPPSRPTAESRAPSESS